MVLSELQKVMMNKINFVGFRGQSSQSPPWIPTLTCSHNPRRVLKAEHGRQFYRMPYTSLDSSLNLEHLGCAISYRFLTSPSHAVWVNLGKVAITLKLWAHHWSIYRYCSSSAVINIHFYLGFLMASWTNFEYCVKSIVGLVNHGRLDLIEVVDRYN